MSGKISPGDVPDYLLERYFLDELPAAERVGIERALEVDPQLQSRLQVLEEDNQEQQQRYPTAWMVGQIEAKRQRLAPRKSRVRRQRLWAISAIPAIAVALAVVALPVLQREQEPDTRIKGHQGIALQVFRDSNGGVERLQDGSLVQPGDLVQLVYRSGESAYGAIYSLDGRGAITRHLPAEGILATALLQGVADTLDFAYELDDAPRWERFYLVAAAEPFALDLVEDALRQRAGRGESELDLPDGYKIATFTLRKPDAP
jgi:hypothetical protein